MYKYIIVFLFFCNRTLACDFCGCCTSPLVMNTDVLSLQPQSSIGSSLSYRNFKYLSSDANMKQTQIITQDFFVSYAPVKWMDIRLSVPISWILNDYIALDANTPDLKEKKFGLEDILLFSNFKVFSRPALGNRKTGHILNLGFGLGFPTGSKKNSLNELLQDFNFGTQTVSFHFSGAYSLSVRNWSLVNSTLIKINIYNKDKVKYGNMYSYDLSVNYTRSLGKVSLTPIMGMRMDISQKNLHNNIIQIQTGGWTLAANIGLQFLVKDIAIYAGIYQPMVQKISAGKISQKTGANFMIRYNIPKRQKLNNLIPENNHS